MYLSLVSFLTFAVAQAAPASWGGDIVQKVIYQPPAGESIIYPRGVQLNDGTLLATASLSTAGEPYFPVFQSKNFGASWTYISNVTDQVNGVGLAAQPTMYQIEQQFGKYPPGTVLAAGNSWSSNFTRIDLYASRDLGYSWEFVSQIAEGTAPNTTNGAHPVWEPKLLEYDNQMVAYYSDQRDPLHGQKLSHQTSTDLVNWGPVVNDVAYSNYTARPGMTNIAHLPNGKWILVHEFPDGGADIYDVGYPVYYRIADTPLTFNSVPGTPIIANKTQPNASPYVVWSPVGGPNGVIIVSDADHSGVYTNTELGAPNAWEYHATPQPDAYSRYLNILNNDQSKLEIVSAAVYNEPAGFTPNISVSVLEVEKILTNAYQ